LPPKELHNLLELVQALNQIDGNESMNSSTPKLLNTVTVYVNERLRVLREGGNITNFLIEKGAGLGEIAYLFMNVTTNHDQFNSQVRKLNLRRKEQVTILSHFLQGRLPSEENGFLDNILLSIEEDIEEVRNPQPSQ
jgi:hypothetical protein